MRCEGGLADPPFRSSYRAAAADARCLGGAPVDIGSGSSHRIVVAPPCPCTASKASILCGQMVVVDSGPRQRRAISPSLQTTPSATWPVPLTPLGSRCRIRTKRRALMAGWSTTARGTTAADHPASRHRRLPAGRGISAPSRRRSDRRSQPLLGTPRQHARRTTRGPGASWLRLDARDSQTPQAGGDQLVSPPPQFRSRLSRPRSVMDADLLRPIVVEHSVFSFQIEVC